MSNFNHAPTYPVARKQHQCAPCLHAIAPGEKHVCQTGFFDGEPYRNRYHQECWDALIAEHVFEFMPGDFEPPERLLNKSKVQP